MLINGCCHSGFRQKGRSLSATSQPAFFELDPQTPVKPQEGTKPRTEEAAHCDLISVPLSLHC